MPDPAAERNFQDEILAHLTANGWLLGSSDQYDRVRAPYPEDVIGYVKDSQSEAWEKFTKIHPQAPEESLLELVTQQLEKADPNATAKDLRKYGTLGVLRHPIKDRGVTLRLCQFKPDHALNPETLAAYAANRLRVVPELKYSPYAGYPAKGMDCVFLPFNKGTLDGGAGNDVPDDGSHPTSYLWREVLQRDTWLKILGRFVHLQVEAKEDWQGKKFKKETLIFPRFHQWDLVTLLMDTAADEGPGFCYLVQHSAGSGKSNSIAWAAHQLSSLHDVAGEKVFHSVIVITDRTVLDSQLQDTIYQFEHREGVVGRINRDEGEGSKSQKLAEALIIGQPIIIVTIQTFPFVLEAIQQNTTLKQRNFAIIADEAHSSQTGTTARKVREVLMAEKREGDEDEEATPISTPWLPSPAK